ncbi:hypothetical protein CDLVIII_0167 [Clostridium sp. DL-VIII]|uniref:TIR domain-containing protein n=1 Tax=Clostridium sp. DL-VIII TaxID=641107 RepID=UPI00023AF811|nr:TIR domain-containing protein [Clostridium sp. DL-VIII]EHI96905.1 hypothetical protein CDLVIII_0167 [Clostridium sp. DL-VIII]
MEEDIILFGTMDIKRADWSKNTGTYYTITHYYEDTYNEIFDKWKKLNGKPMYGIGYYVINYKHLDFYFIKIKSIEIIGEKFIIEYDSISSSNKRSELLYGFENIGDSKIIAISTKEKLKYWLNKNRMSINLENYLGNSKSIVDKSKVFTVHGHDELAVEQTANIGISKKTLVHKKKKLFISHSSKNRNITDEFVELLKAMGITNDEIYYSSYEETGVDFLQDCFQRINQEFNNNELMVIFMISREFYQSKICLAETGAAWVSVANKYIPIIIPPYSYNNIEGVINATQAAIDLNDKNVGIKLETLKDHIEEFLGKKNKDNKEAWHRNKEKFIELVKNQANELDDIKGKIFGITVIKNKSSTNIIFKINLINNKRYRMKIEEFNIELCMKEEKNEKITIKEGWYVEALVLQPLDEITVYIPTDIDREVTNGIVDIKNSKVKIIGYKED